MPAAFSQAELDLFKSLNEQGVRFLIVGLSSAALQGAPVVTEDIDIWVENLGGEKFLKAVEKANGFYVPPGVAGVNPPMLGPQALRLIDLVTTVQGLDDFSTEYENAIDIMISGIRLSLLSLERIILSKSKADRPKDRAVLPLLKSIQSSKK